MLDIRDIKNLNDRQLSRVIQEAMEERSHRRSFKAEEYKKALTALISEILDGGYNLDFRDGYEDCYSLSPCNTDWWVNITP